MNNLLMYQIPPEKSRIIKSIALQHGFRIRVVQPEEAGASVGALADVPVTLKAVVTEHNASWSFARLHENLVEEHAAMQKKMENKA